MGEMLRDLLAGYANSYILQMLMRNTTVTIWWLDKMTGWARCRAMTSACCSLLQSDLSLLPEKGQARVHVLPSWSILRSWL